MTIEIDWLGLFAIATGCFLAGAACGLYVAETATEAPDEDRQR